MSLASALGWAVGLAALGGIGVVLLLAFADSTRLIKPSDYRHPREAGFRYPEDPMTAHGLAFEEVAVDTPQGGPIRGWLVPGQPETRKAVLAVHGRASDRRAFLPLVPALNRAGAATLLIDLRENGTSGGAGRGTGLGMREAEDIDSAVAALQARGFATIAVVGCSLGGSAALIAAARNPQIDAVIADSAMTSMTAFVADLARKRLGPVARLMPDAAVKAWASLVIAISRWRADVPDLVDAGSVVAQIAPRPILLIQGLEDQAVEGWHTEDLLARAEKPKFLWQVPGASHCGALAADGGAYADRVVQILNDAASVARAEVESSQPLLP